MYLPRVPVKVGSSTRELLLVTMVCVGCGIVPSRIARANDTEVPPNMSPALGAPRRDGWDLSDVSRHLRIQSDLTVTGELYAVDGIEARRPSSLGTMAWRGSVTLWGGISLGAEFLQSTDGSRQRQRTEQFGLAPSWSWGTARIGDFSENYSSLSLSGIRVRGAALDLKPGWLRLSAVGGSTQRATTGTTRAYQREILGGRLGVGRQEAGYFDIIVMRLRDDVNSLEPLSVTVPPESLGVVPQEDVTPAENIVGGINTRVSALGQKLVWETEVMASLMTRDLRAANDIDSGELPSFLPEFVTLNNSSRGDIAGSTQLNLALGRLTVASGYRYVGPGYESLGLGSQGSDTRELTVNPALMLGGLSISANYTSAQDNLRRQKVATTDRSQYGGSLSFSPFRRFQSNVNGSYLLMANDAPADFGAVDFNTLSLNTTQTYSFGGRGLMRSISLNLSLIEAGDRVPSSRTPETTTRSGNLVISMSPFRKATLSLNGGQSNIRTGERVSRTQRYALQMRYQTWRDRLTLSGAATLTLAEEGTRSSVNALAADLALSRKDRISYSATPTVFRSTSGATPDYTELRQVLSYNRRF